MKEVGKIELLKGIAVTILTPIAIGVICYLELLMHLAAIFVLGCVGLLIMHFVNPLGYDPEN